jgi:membrane associated rhomboid family serine protease
MTTWRREEHLSPPPAEVTGGAGPSPRQRPPGQRAPAFSWVVIVVSVAVYLYETMLDPNPPDIQRGALFGPWVQDGEWYRVFGTVFEHGGPLHLIMNMSVVWTVGMPLERAIGTWRFVLLSVASALGSSAFALLFNFNVPTVGASGMILGWAGAMIPIVTPEYRRSHLTWLAQIALISFLPFVSWAGHLGGFLFGFPCGYGLLKGGKRFVPVTVAISIVGLALCGWATVLDGRFEVGSLYELIFRR